jgi:hypothetical protein
MEDSEMMSDPELVEFYTDLAKKYDHNADIWRSLGKPLKAAMAAQQSRHCLQIAAQHANGDRRVARA